MAFLRFTRDKRGYEHFYLVESSPRRGKSPTRVLYWFRTPPNVKVGREPFDDRVRRELETQNPDVVFDWRRILDTPIPSADAEKWRERRRAERAAKALRKLGTQEAEEQTVEPVGEEPGELVPLLDEALEGAEAEEREPGEADESEDNGEAPADAPVHVLEAAAATVPLDSAIPPDLSPPHASNEGTHAPPADGARRKRRRRRRRRGHGGQGGGGSSSAGPAGV